MAEPSAGRTKADALLGRWVARFPELPGVGPRLLAAYGDASRRYHDVDHLAEVLDRLDLLSGPVAVPVTVELAAWLHDAVYDVHRDDNEEASARLAVALLKPVMAGDVVDEVARLVLLTRGHDPDRDDAGGALLCDADLAVLAGDPASYASYVARVRAEYADVGDEDFRAGRSGVLRRLLALPVLFHTAHGRTHWEQPARRNLAAELGDHPR